MQATPSELRASICLTFSLMYRQGHRSSSRRFPLLIKKISLGLLLMINYDSSIYDVWVDLLLELKSYFNRWRVVRGGFSFYSELN